MLRQIALRPARKSSSLRTLSRPSPPVLSRSYTQSTKILRASISRSFYQAPWRAYRGNVCQINQLSRFYSSKQPSSSPKDSSPISQQDESQIRPSTSTEPPSPDYSTLQDEFQTSYPNDSNSAPQSTSPSAINPAHQRQRSKPLPDLTQGIPSSIDSDPVDGGEGKANPGSLNITEDPSAGGSKGELPKTAYISSLERRKRRFGRLAYAFLFANITLGTVYYGRNWETEEEERRHPQAPSGWGFGLFFGRFKARLGETLEYYNEPTFPKLLPDPDPAWARPYTLVVSLEDLLVHSEWSREHGWRMAKRPGVDYFLRYLSSYYELVIWTSSQSMVAQPVIAKLDPYRVVMWPLFREATRYQDGSYVKDLSFLNRDPKKILIMDTESAHVSNQPENAIVMPKWTGDASDKDLVAHIPFLEYCATMNFGDLREVLKSFQGKDIPKEYARRETIMREKYQKQMSEELQKRPKRSMGFMSAIAGPSTAQLMGPDGKPLPTLSEAMAQGKTYQDVVRERGQKQYEMLEHEIRENGQKWLSEMAEEEKKMNEEAMQGVKKSIFGWVPGLGGNPDTGKENGIVKSGKDGGGAEARK